jgi:hypothetical protein
VGPVKNYARPISWQMAIGHTLQHPQPLVKKPMSTSSTIIARVGALCYMAWGVFHVKVAHDIYVVGSAQMGIAQGRLYQLSVYMLCIATFAIVVAAVGNWRNGERSYWLNLIVVGWADAVWVLVVVLPGYVPLLRGLLPPAIYVLGGLLTTVAYRRAR